MQLLALLLGADGHLTAAASAPHQHTRTRAAPNLICCCWFPAAADVAHRLIIQLEGALLTHCSSCCCWWIGRIPAWRRLLSTAHACCGCRARAAVLQLLQSSLQLMHVQRPAGQPAVRDAAAVLIWWQDAVTEVSATSGGLLSRKQSYIVLACCCCLRHAA
jgi:hypothetical protein